ncbi:MarR family transcriptional regulator [Palleronia sp. LCG004]|uniref:MarR family winged helix-turn-helix transcriptional regulator n=1 Tax=Palleronia sp. LCG004 TaxID=3079304 RepID=UPI0029438F6D|nr:MarR family transcriptional regulator [Palleronia sp. LCG004]WOI55262.1 MarR family transcriptional regulator [Palleronia sp. LCG004]
MGQTSDLDATDGDLAATSDLEGLIGYNLKRAYVIVLNDFRATLGEEGLSPRSFSALSLVVQNPHVTQSALARMLGIERSGLVAIIDTLERQGYLDREAVPGDRRIQALVPTRAGRTAHAEARAAVERHEEALFSGLAPADRRRLLQILRDFRAAHESGEGE